MSNEETKQGLEHLTDETLADIVNGSHDLSGDNIAQIAFRELARRTPE